MKLKSIISFFLILVLSIQLLPVKQIVNWLLSGQATEEIVDAKDSSKSTGFDEANKHFLAAQYALQLNAVISSLIAGHHEAEALVARHADDIPTPPPNC